jgi:membrane protein DedA with SNARE-associated domain
MDASLSELACHLAHHAVATLSCSANLLHTLVSWASNDLIQPLAAAADVLSHLTASVTGTVTAPGAGSLPHEVTTAANSLHHAAAQVDPTHVEAADGLPAWIEPYIKYGPWAILIIFILSGVGLHLSEDLILIPAGILIASGKLDWFETLAAAYVGLVIGDLLWLAMCRRFGTKMVHSRWFKRVVHPRRLLEAKHQMEAKGILVVILARFVPGTRTPVITMAGILHLQWWKLVVVEFLTCAVTVPLQVGLGYVAAVGMGEAKSTGEFIVKLVAITAAFVLAGLGIHWWISSRRRAGRAPRSKAAWLRTFGRRRRESSAHAPAR